MMYLMCLEMTSRRTFSDTPFLRMRREANIVTGIAMKRKMRNEPRIVISSANLALYPSVEYFMASTMLVKNPIKKEMP